MHLLQSFFDVAVIQSLRCLPDCLLYLLHVLKIGEDGTGGYPQNGGDLTGGQGGGALFPDDL